jgi:hypothetical protein
VFPSTVRDGFGFKNLAAEIKERERERERERESQGMQ